MIGELENMTVSLSQSWEAYVTTLDNWMLFFFYELKVILKWVSKQTLAEMRSNLIE